MAEDPTLVNSTNSPTEADAAPLYIHSVIRISAWAADAINSTMHAVTMICFMDLYPYVVKKSGIDKTTMVSS